MQFMTAEGEKEINHLDPAKYGELFLACREATSREDLDQATLERDEFLTEALTQQPTEEVLQLLHDALEEDYNERKIPQERRYIMCQMLERYLFLKAMEVLKKPKPSPSITDERDQIGDALKDHSVTE